MASYFDNKMFADLVRAKRGRRGLRQVTLEQGISASTISRIENGSIPDLDTFLAVCDWLKICPCEFIKNSERRRNSGDVYAAVCARLRTDETVDGAVGNALALLIEAVSRQSDRAPTQP